MTEAANLAGNAINVSKTTAAHAWSYGFTSSQGIPHGHAVWLTLPTIFELHYQRSRANDRDFEIKMDRLCAALNLDTSKDKSLQLIDHLSNLGITYDFAELNIDTRERKSLANSVNMERMKNNPVVFDGEEVEKIFQLSF